MPKNIGTTAKTKMIKVKPTASARMASVKSHRRR